MVVAAVGTLGVLELVVLLALSKVSWPVQWPLLLLGPVGLRLHLQLLPKLASRRWPLQRFLGLKK